MSDFVFIVECDRGDGFDSISSFYCSEPQMIAGAHGKEYAGGFGPISGAITFTTGQKARTARNRLAKIYADIDAIEMKVRMYTRKEFFQARLK